jgi:hypothetical protein
MASRAEPLSDPEKDPLSSTRPAAPACDPIWSWVLTSSPAELLPVLKGLIADPMPLTELAGRHAGLTLFENADYLLLAAPVPAHASSSGYFRGGSKK